MIEFDEYEEDVMYQPGDTFYDKEHDRLMTVVPVARESIKPEEVDIKKTMKVYNEVRDNILKTIDVNDSYFYASITFMRNMDPMFMRESIDVIIKMKLVNSEEFKHDYLSSQKKTVKTKDVIIRDRISLDEYRFMEDLDTLMEYFYKRLSEQLAKDLLSQGMRDFHMSVNGYGRGSLRMKNS